MPLREDYAGPFDPEVRLASFSRQALADLGREYLLIGHLQDRAGLPLVMRYKATSTGGTLPEGWALPEELRDDTGVIFASAFPGADRMVDEVMKSLRGRR